MGSREMQEMTETKKAEFNKKDESRTPSMSKSNILLSDTDGDTEANEGTSLSMMQKAILRASVHGGRGGEGSVVVTEMEVGGEDIVMTELVDWGSAQRTMKKERKDKIKKFEIEAHAVSIIPLPDGQATASTKASEQDDADRPDNAVLRQLLRGPRYFDPSYSSWGACYTCGEEGHSAVNCKLAKRKKPCFVCGSFEHGARFCQKGKYCSICKQSGHRAKGCPEKFIRCSKECDVCLKCGSFGHYMSSCSNDYSLDDLKQIQCYICKSFGHLCCANYTWTMAAQISCYKCGQLGHTGLAHKRSRNVDGVRTPGSCFKCGQEGHFARECVNSNEDKVQSCDWSTPKMKALEEEEARGGGIMDLDKVDKVLAFDEEKSASSSKWSPRGGQIMGDPGDLPSSGEAHFDEETTPNPSKWKPWGGRIKDNPGDFPSFRQAQFDEEITPNPSKYRPWGGPIMDNHGDFSYRNDQFDEETTPNPSKWRPWGGRRKDNPGDSSCRSAQFDEETTPNSGNWRPWGGRKKDNPGDFPPNKAVTSEAWESCSTPNGETSNLTSQTHPSSNCCSSSRFDSSHAEEPDSQLSEISFQNGHSGSHKHL